MKTRLLILSLVLVSCLTGCRDSDEIEFERGKASFEEKDIKEALKHYKRVMQRTQKKQLAISAAKEAARISQYELKNFEEALAFYKYIVVESQDSIEQVNAQKKISEIFFQQLADYKQSIVEYSRLLDLPLNDVEKKQFRLALAKSYFYSNNFFQAKVEAQRLLNKENIRDPGNFDPILLEANIELANKNVTRAIVLLESLLKQFPERSKKEMIAMNLGLCYEEVKNYDKAIQIYEAAKANHPTPDFLNLRIQRMKMRKTQLPGAQGLQK